jgi:glycerol-3-phosphate O-acyltransferase/dihydroxyacetone phosphate acyltransferase
MDKHDSFYALVRLTGRFWIWFLFRSVDVRHADRVPREGPVLLCINHPNNLIDSLLVGAVVERKVHYLATAALFRNPIVSRFLKAVGAIPVYRRQDDPDKMDRNVGAFEACVATLASGGLIGIYPEGTTHAESRVQRIKTGAARIALDYELQRQSQRESQRESRGRAGATGAPLVLIPTGLAFEARKSFGGRVRVSFGEPIALAPYVDLFAQHPVKAVDELTTAIQWGMEAEVVHVERLDSASLVREVESIYRDHLVRELQEERGLSAGQIDTVRLSRSIADAAAYFETHAPERIAELRDSIGHYRAMLAAYHVRDQAVRERIEPPPVRQRLNRGWKAAIGLPIFGYGLVTSGLPYLVPRWIARRTATKETNYATTRLLASVICVPLFWGVETWLVWRLAGALWALGFFVSLPVSSILAYHYLRGIGRLRAQARLGVVNLTRHQAATRLLAERRRLIDLLERAKNDYLAATKGSSF